ncbi:hypothetical protein Ae201684_007728 [Aphanomyces euteiches]|uniref:BD-FAE-like domain-containing protein n=1 Tax=Aphanomyces euteiches TaxID=100861 RepID=A0A6G0X708_9STRA|nr:hypothetical protein Ae201684_007728 [Aphanomyces euteiches]KAH9142922.1 hypothetical protein AeRB84_013042 [Aphanomyces euteiches]
MFRDTLNNLRDDHITESNLAWIETREIELFGASAMRFGHPTMQRFCLRCGLGQLGNIGNKFKVFKAFRSSHVYAAVVWLGNAGNVFFGLSAPKLAMRTLARALRFSTTNFRYGPHERQVLDLYGTTSTDTVSSLSLKPVLIFVHGGAWALSSKFDHATLGETLAEHDIVTVIPSYRTFPHGEVDDMIDDLRDVIAWTIENIASHGGDPKRISLAGHSSGAHLTSLLLVRSAFQDSLFPDPVEPVHHVKSFIGLCGPYDITDHYEFERDRHIIPFVRAHGISPLHPSCHGRHQFPKYSPTAAVLNLATTGSAWKLPSFHLFHGADDVVVPSQATHKFAKHLKQVGATVHVHNVPFGHVEILLALMGGFPQLEKTMMDAVVPVIKQTADAVVTWSGQSKL